MKKWIGIILLLIGMYFATVFVRAELSEMHAERQLEVILNEIASPWESEKIRLYGSEWLNNRARLTPEEIARRAENDLGALREIVQGPECIFQSGYESGNPHKKMTWAMCKVTARFEKKTAKLNIRLVDEQEKKPKLLGLLGQSLKFNDIADIQLNENGGRK